jgi:hypothetical protein
LRIRGAGDYKKYISEYGIQCYTWKDKGADIAFNNYLKFIKTHTIKAVLEIDLKRNN